MLDDRLTLDKVFAKNGVLSEVITGFTPRESQTQMAQNVEKVIHTEQSLVVEAGTGTGKTFAYLVPALLSEKKVIVSTGSKNLQDQLYSKDLPLIKDILNYSGKLSLLKGRANYLCIERLHNQIAESHGPSAQKTLLAELMQVRSWSSMSKTGDLSECEYLAEDSQVIPSIISSNDNCLGKDCPSFEECFVQKARRRAMDADVVVVNHHLFLADLAIKETGFGELIPNADVFIFDEAHQLPDIATQYFGTSLTSRQLFDLAKDIELSYRTELRDQKQLGKVAERLNQIVMDLRLVLGEPGFRGNLRELFSRANIQNALEVLTETLELCEEIMRLSLGRCKLLDVAYERLILQKGVLARVMDTSVMGYSYWYECTKRHFSFNITPLSVAERFSEQQETIKGSWIFTSATLAIDNNFAYFTSRLGIKPFKAFSLPSAFDYQKQALLCVPKYLPDVKRANSAQLLVKQLTPMIEVNQGRTFVLCTSHRRVKEIALALSEESDLPVLAQGEMPKQRLLEEYLNLGNAILVATSAFWEGVDVRGQALSCVIIDKLPFSSPDDPLLKARIEDCRLANGEPFYEVQLPDAVIALKQGVGRLIRDRKDQGVVVICDNRLVTRDYGEVFLASLPTIPRTRDLQRCEDYLQRIVDNEVKKNDE